MAGRRQFGRVRKLASGRWQARYPDGNGRDMPAPCTFLTKSDATLFLASVQADMARGQFRDPREGKVTLERLANDWLARPGKRATSVARDRQALVALLKTLGPMPLSAITLGHVQAAVDERAKVVSPATLVRDVSTLRAVLNSAVKTDRIVRSPARHVTLPTVRPPLRKEVTPAGLARLGDQLPANYRALVLTGAVLGLRWGEAIGLRVRDIDFKRREVTVAQTVEELSGHLRIVPEAKTKASLRTMTVPTFLIKELARHLVQHRSGLSADSEELVFLGPRGGILRRRFVERILTPAVEAVREEDIAQGRMPSLPQGLTFHALRHVAITAMADAGVPFNVTKGRAGHSTAKLTMELYSHRTTDGDRAAAEALEGYFGTAFSDG